jgi:NAD(P) transhydrogenase subunit alpha
MLADDMDNAIPTGASLRVGVLREAAPGERRVAVTPTVVPLLARTNLQVVVETGLGSAAGFEDEAYGARGATIATRGEALSADVLLCVRPGDLAADDQALAALHPDQIVVGLADPLGEPDAMHALADRKVILFALELLPRITRAQAMDALSSQATVAGYQAVLLAAGALPRLFPMMITAAGSIPPAKVFVIGAGVAGLQAIATARRLGAVVEAYDVRPAVRDEVESLGARFVELPLQPGDAADASGYAKALGEEFYRRQRELLTKVVAASDVVLTTALIPGRPAPVLVTGEMVAGMRPGSVIVDLASERGGNCELTVADHVVERDGVRIFGPTDLPSRVAVHASEMYAKNLSAFVLGMVRDGRVDLDADDEILAATLVCRGGELVHPRVRAAWEAIHGEEP